MVTDGCCVSGGEERPLDRGPALPLAGCVVTLMGLPARVGSLGEEGHCAPPASQGCVWTPDLQEEVVKL